LMPSSSSTALLTPAEMYEADAAATRLGVTSLMLMENAGLAVAEEIFRRWLRKPVTVICGPGNNGGDGFVVARLLYERGWPAQVLKAGRHDGGGGAAAANAERWRGPTSIAAADLVPRGGIIVDALFGAGLSRDIESDIARIIHAANASAGPIVAVDMPSGIDGASGLVRGTAIVAELTVSFCRKKPGHLLFPGRRYCGELVIADIGISDAVVEAVGSQLHENNPASWRLPSRSGPGHKYEYGHVAIVSGGPWNTGAARLAAVAALRIGAGLVTVAASRAALPSLASHLTSVMLREVEDAPALASFLEDRRINVVVVGPAGGVGEETKARSRAALRSGAAVVMDADALTSFSADPGELFSAIGHLPVRPVVLTPHEGEFRRLFGTPPPALNSKIDRARWAAAASGATIVLKGADSVIAGPDARAMVNSNAPPDLATAGSGDVLAGIIAGLLAQGMSAFEAAAAGVWIHGRAGNALGRGLIAEDLPGVLPEVLQELR
jgi:hydroxyethylthiazole kinase-like uncharacterized protein yjeF